MRYCRFFIGRRVDLSVGAGEFVIRAERTEIARHRVVGPGELSLCDAHYGRAAYPRILAVRPRTAAEIAFPRSRGAARLVRELAEIADLERAHGRAALTTALERALVFVNSGQPISVRSSPPVSGAHD